MRIGYVGKHEDTNSNDEEGAIYHALQQLGHRVDRLRESRGRNAWKIRCDMLLFHKWHDVVTLKKCGAPKVFWYFDLVEFKDRTMRERSQSRGAWMKAIIPRVDLGFCTDGDWVKKDQTGKLVWLPQGADQRVAGRGAPLGEDEEAPPPILFTGTRYGGRERESWVNEMSINYRTAFNHVTGGVHGDALKNLIAKSSIVVAPDAPITHHYWSNRVYLMLGYGAFLLHPYCIDLASQYTHGQEIVFYKNRADLHDKIKRYYNDAEERRRISDNALSRTLREHTYINRCRELIRRFEERPR